MSNYTFETLDDKDLEELTRDLLQKELKITLESFKRGKDGGFDLRYSSGKDTPNTIIVQVKHYLNSGFDLLYRHLEKDEVPKVKNEIKPDKYILVTSVGLTPQNKSKIQKLFQPFILTTGDIYGRDDLNNLLKKFPEIKTEMLLFYGKITKIMIRKN